MAQKDRIDALENKLDALIGALSKGQVQQPTVQEKAKASKEKKLRCNVGIEPQADGSLHLVLRAGDSAGYSSKGRELPYSTAGWLDCSAAGEAWEGIKLNLNGIRSDR